MLPAVNKAFGAMGEKLSDWDSEYRPLISLKSKSIVAAMSAVHCRGELVASITGPSKKYLRS